MSRFVVRLAYDGSAFQGWQKQPHQRTVQGELERALSEIAKETITTIGSSRTDTGVHALNQYAHFDFPIRMTPEQIKLALITKLPKDMQIIKVYRVVDDFNARYQAIGRKYKFIIAKELTPFNRLYKSYFPKYKIEKVRIDKCLPLFLGRTDFEFFCRKSEDINTFISVVDHCTFSETEEDFIFEIAADRFLHNMVRRIIGTLVRLSDEDDIYYIVQQLLAGNRKYLHLVYTAPPQGLYLVDVLYPEGEFARE
ncbi:MAG: tRNA pseudouridine(38-40) synthase TruA [Candidatus Cloacimonetes bacterium]|nr:tRNA pseudouridine(38-40) synthase TruA [Candidatus Cloacimonadota bacterium]